MIYEYGFKIRGASHKKDDSPCQDAYATIRCGDDVFVAAVADGLGSAEYSDVGSQMAVDIATRHCAEHIEPRPDADGMSRIIRESFVKALLAIENEAKTQDRDFAHYLTTLSLGILFGDTLYYGHSGDSGIIALTTEGLFSKVTEQQQDEEERVYPLNFTDMWVFGEFDKNVCSVLLVTDGILLRLIPRLLKNELVPFHVNMLGKLMDNRCLHINERGEEVVKAEIENYVRSIPPLEVNNDDVAVVVLINTSLEPGRQPEEYYREPNWAEIVRERNENFERSAYPDRFENDNNESVPDEEASEDVVASDIDIIGHVHQNNADMENNASRKTETQQAPSPGVWKWLLSPFTQSRRVLPHHHSFVGQTGTVYHLDADIWRKGGEGEIYRVFGGNGKLVAKIYTDMPSGEMEKKLLLMTRRRDQLLQHLPTVAWPLDLLYDGNRQFRGYVMPELSFNTELDEIYEYQSKNVQTSNKNKVRIARNICAVTDAVHRMDYVFGDFNPRNIGVDKNTGNVFFLDTDAYHIVDYSQKQTYRCLVGAQGYIAPELLEAARNHLLKNPGDACMLYARMSLPTFTRETDLFALAIHIFKLLMNGSTPYGGILDSSEGMTKGPSSGDAAVLEDCYCFKPGYKLSGRSLVLPLVVFPAEISNLFTRAFIDGRRNPKQRPSAREWYEKLARYEDRLIPCRVNPLHHYDRKNATCPYCEANQRFSMPQNAVETPTEKSEC